MKMKTNRSLAAVLVSSSALIAPGLFMGILAAPTMAAAQAAPAAPAAAAPANSTQVQEVVVTGTLFRTKVESASPVTVLSQQAITNQGITTVADAIRSVSADNSGTVPTAFGIGFAVGASGVALRGLTVNSTLVLIDGYRTANYALADDGERGFVDLNTIPESIVDHVDVLKDGASAIYGADAIGGVVNIIMKPTYQGEEIIAEGGTSQHGGGTMERVAGTVGYGDLDTDRFNAYLNVEYQHDDKIRVGQRGFPYNTNDYSSLGGIDNLGGQPGNFSGSIYGSVADATTGGLYQILSPTGCGPLGTKTTLAGTGTFCEQNFTLYSDDQPEETRYGAYARFTLKINPNTTAYLNTSYYQNTVRVDTDIPQIQSPIPVNTNAITIPAMLSNGSLNPNDPFAALGDPAYINYAFGDIPAYTLEVNHVFRSVLDLKGSAWGWDYEAAGVVAHTWLNSTYAGYLNYNQLIADINDGAYSFINPSSNTAAVRSALAPNLDKTSTTDLDTINVQGSHALMDLPGGPLNLAIGAAWRYEATYDPDLNPNLAAQGLGIAHTIGQRNVTSAFAELDAPVVKTVDIDVAGRFDHYSDFGNNVSPKVAFKWTPVKQIALRATYSLGFRAPSFSENGSSASEGFTTYAANSDPAFVAAHHGDAYVENNYNLGQLTTANPNIKPEKSQSFTVGAIVQPISSISLSVDYYHIKKTQVIAQPNSAVALADYYAGVPLPAGFTVTPDVPDPLYPNAPLRPEIVGAAYINANSLITDGLDFDFRFKHELPYDIKFTTDVSITDVLTWSFNQPGEPTLNYVGTESPYILSSGAGTPKWRGSWETTFTRGPLSVTTTVNYVSGMKMYTSDIFGPGDTCAAAIFDGLSGNNCATGSFIDLDLNVTYQINDKVEVYTDMLNVTDAKPPFDPIDYAGVNYNPTFAQAGIVGRYFKFGVRAKF